MTGAALLAQVRRWIPTAYHDDLDGCVLLTAAEAEKVRLGLLNPTARLTKTAGDILPTFRTEALALLGGEKPAVVLSDGHKGKMVFGGGEKP